MTAEPTRPPGTAGHGASSWIARRVQRGEALVVGCEVPATIIGLARNGVRVTAFDTKAEPVEHARAALKDAGVEATVDHVEASEWPYPAGSFDAVVLDRVLEHQLAPGRMVEEARKALKESGSLLVVARYGLHAHGDHADALYLGRLAGLLAPSFTIEIADLDGSLVMIEARCGASTPDLAALLAVAERRLGQIDRELLDAHRNTERQRERADGLDRSVRMMQASRAWRLARKLRALRRKS